MSWIIKRSHLRIALRLAIAAVLAGGLLWSVPAHAATIAVKTFADELNTNSVCSLREAIRAANLNTRVGACAAGSSTSADTITLAAGSYVLSRAGIDENAAATGDLDLTGKLTITGAGAGSTFIDAASLDRVFDIRPGATVTLARLTIRNGSTDRNGGGIYNAGTLTLNNATVTAGSAGAGGGIFSMGTLTLNRTTVSSSYSSSGHGGGLYIGGRATLTESSVRNNRSEDQGGGIQNAGALRIVRSTISGNGAFEGGGIYNGSYQSQSTLTISNSTISSNHAEDLGAGISNNETGTIAINASTITRNDHVQIAGGGISNRGGMVTISNTLIAGNLKAGDGPEPNDCEGTLTSQGYNLVQAVPTDQCTISGDTTGNRIGVDPGLGPLRNNGGPTMTHALAINSPAVDAGSGAAVGSSSTACPTVDQRNVSRPKDGNLDGKLRCDIGAYELQRSATNGQELLPPDTSDEVLPDESDRSE